MHFFSSDHCSSLLDWAERKAYFRHHIAAAAAVIGIGGGHISFQHCIQT
jgi:hypothetical protein